MSDFFTDTDLIGPPTNAPAVFSFGSGDLIAAPLATQALLMDETEARESLDMMRGDIGMIDTYGDSFRRRALDFKEREGWKALGYDGYIAAIQTELGAQYSKSYLSRLIQAAEIERVLELPIGNSVPESVLREVAKLATPDRQRAAYKAASTNGKPTAAKVQQAAAEIAQPDLPIEFDIIKRRFAALGHTLAATWDGKTQRFVIRKDGGTGAVLEWPAVLSRLERLENDDYQQQLDKIAQADAASLVTEPDHGPADNAAAYDAKEQRDAGRLLRARTLIGNGEIDAARVVLSGIEVATWSRDKLLAEIPAARQITLAFSDAECAALRKEARMFANSELTKKLPTVGQALTLLIAGMQG